jgi:REP-associated tyrosine transposase
MARSLRLEFEGAIYHVTARGNRREPIFADDRDRAHFLELVAQSLVRYQVELHAYVLLTNHFHLLARTQRANLSRWMHWLLVSYTVGFNRRHRKVGHLFQGRYKSLVVEEGEYLLELSRYLHLNPVRGRMLGAGEPGERRRRLRSYRWSSYLGYAGLGRQPGWMSEELVLGEFGGRRGRERKVRYRRFVEEGLLRELRDPSEAAQWQCILGSEGFLQEIIAKMQVRRHARREIKALRRATRGTDPRAIVALVAKEYGVNVGDLLVRKGYGLEARNVALWAVWQSCDWTLREIGALFGGMDYAAVAQRIKRTKQAAESSERLKRVLTECQNI